MGLDYQTGGLGRTWSYEKPIDMATQLGLEKQGWISGAL